MNDLHAQIADQVRHDFLELGLVGPGPDLAAVRRRGRARRRRRQAVVVAGAAVALSAAGVLAVNGLTWFDDASRPAAATPAPASPTTVPESVKVSGIFHAALGTAGVVAPESVEANGLTGGETSVPMGWEMRWRDTGTDPDTNVTVEVYPLGRPGPETSCADPDRVARECTEVTWPNGIRVAAGEFRSELADGGDRWTVWSPEAVAVYPDGREVHAGIGYFIDDAPSGVVVTDYAGQVTVDKLKALVQDPRLATIHLPSSP
jgi:hypothetical protein